MRAADIVDDPVIGPSSMGATSGMEGFLGLFVLLFIGAAVFSAVVGIRKYRILRDAGTDPFTVDAAVAAKVLRSDMLRDSEERAVEERSMEERLAELDGLLARGVITADEHREARAAVLRS